MRRLRIRFILLLYVVVGLATFLSIALAACLRLLIYPGTNPMDALMFGFALKDVLTPIYLVCFTAVFIGVVSKWAVGPVVDISSATKEIASGNFGIRIEETRRRDEIGDLQRNFNLMAKELQSNEYLKKEFISNVSHEFKTPLSVIHGYAVLLEKDGVSEGERKEYAQLIVRESEKLSNMTANILRLSKLDNQEIKPKPVSFPLDEQIRQSVLLLEPKWSAKQIEFDIRLPSVQYFGDGELLSQVWVNLIDNAVKYSHEKGKVRITLSLMDNAVCVTVRDNGIGMNEETRLRVFDQFYQGDTSRAREGNGLGMPIVKRIVEMHGGKVDVESEPGRGTAVTVWLPMILRINKKPVKC
jgi:Signal transduction histidine kinase